MLFLFLTWSINYPINLRDHLFYIDLSWYLCYFLTQTCLHTSLLILLAFTFCLKQQFTDTPAVFIAKTIYQRFLFVFKNMIRIVWCLLLFMNLSRFFMKYVRNFISVTLNIQNNLGRIHMNYKTFAFLKKSNKSS